MTVVLQDWPTQALEVLFALNLYDREVKKWIPKSRIVKRFVKESGKSWDTWVEIGNKIGTAQGYWDHSKYQPVQINIIHSNKDLEEEDEDKDKDEDEDEDEDEDKDKDEDEDEDEDEDKDEDKDKDDNEYKDGCPKYGSCVMCGHVGRYGNYCEQWDCESSGAICVDPVNAMEEDEGWNRSDSN
jgi:hypothetical protein